MLVKSILAAAFAVILVACSQPSPLQQSMQGMAKGIKMVARNQQDITKQLEGWRLAHESLLLAQQQKILADDQAEFDKGLVEVAELLKDLAPAIRSGNVEYVAALVEQIKQKQEQYHEAIITQKQTG